VFRATIVYSGENGTTIAPIAGQHDSGDNGMVFAIQFDHLEM
jgi:hypothetical protein